MKQKLLLSLFALLTATVAWADVRINSTNFPDANFRNWLLEQDYGADGKLTNDEIAAIDYIDVSGKDIKSLNGIGYFTALEELECSSNQLTALNVSGCTALTWIACWGNKITGTGMDALVESLPTTSGGELYVISNENEQNKMSKTQVTAAKAKGWRPMYLDNNSLWSEYISVLTIDAATFPDENFRNWLFEQDYGADGVLKDEEIAAVTYINVGFRSIQSLKGIEYFTALTELKCYSNQLTSLDVSGCTALTKLHCYWNQLTTLDVSKNTALTYLSCYGNQLTSLDVSQNTALTYLSCYNNQLTALDVSKNTALTYLYCSSNQLTALDVSKNTALRGLECDGNQLTSFDVSQNTALTTLHCSSNQLTALDASQNAALTYIVCYNNQLTSLDVSGCAILTGLECYNNQLTSLDVSGCTALTQLYCNSNQLTSLDVSGCTALEYLYCNSNQLTSLDVSGCTALPALSCFQNQIKGAAMDALLESLPTVSYGTLYVIYNENEQNVMTTNQVAAAKEKGWEPEYYDGSWWQEYAGSEPVNPSGDLNGDFKVDIADAVSVLNIMAGGGNDPAADLNNDGKVDIADFVSVLNLMAEQ